MIDGKTIIIVKTVEYGNKATRRRSIDAWLKTINDLHNKGYKAKDISMNHFGLLLQAYYMNFQNEYDSIEIILPEEKIIFKQPTVQKDWFTEPKES